MELLSESYLALFLIIALGLILGQIKIRGFSLDVSAVIFIALFLGHFGVRIPQDFRKVGLVLFIFTVGLQAGPGFFRSFRRYGQKLLLTVVIIIFSGAAVTIGLSYLFHIDFKIAVGLFTGALTSTPGLATAIESTNSPLASIGYGVAYPFGILGVILFLRILPRLLRTDIRTAEEEYEQLTRQDYPEISNQNFIVENANIDGKTIGDLNIRSMTQATISRVMHEGVSLIPTAETVLHLGDRIKAVGTQKALDRVKLLIGKATGEDLPLSQDYDFQWILVTNKKVVNKRLSQLNLWERYNAVITRIRRSGIDISPKPQSVLRFGDRLMVITDKTHLKETARLLGNNEKILSGTDFLPIAVGIVLGVLLGNFSLPFIGGVEIKLGMTGGVLISALVLSRIGKTGPIIWSLTGSSNQLLRQLGLLLFLASVGTEAGAHLVETIQSNGPLFLGVGAIITLVPMIIGALAAHYVFKLNVLTMMGVISGGMTSTPGLAAIDSMSESNAPKVAYAAVYPLALICVILASQVIARL